MAKRGVNDPPLPLGRRPDRIAVPGKGILCPPVPRQVTNVPGLPLDAVPRKQAPQVVMDDRPEVSRPSARRNGLASASGRPHLTVRESSNLPRLMSATSP